MSKQMGTREEIEVKFRFHGETIGWEDRKIAWSGLVDISNRKALRDILAQAAAVEEVVNGVLVSEMRWNATGSYQGHYQNVGE